MQAEVAVAKLVEDMDLTVAKMVMAAMRMVAMAGA